MERRRHFRHVARAAWGAWYDLPYNMASWARLSDVYPSLELPQIGFRVASVPEPTSVVLSIFASGMLLIRRKR